jgi:hypothetical protein
MTAQDKKFVGPTGKKFRMDCPKGCFEATGTVIGSMIYSDESNVCKAAIHAGKINNDGGPVMMVISNGENKYDSAM